MHQSFASIHVLAWLSLAGCGGAPKPAEAEQPGEQPVAKPGAQRQAKSPILNAIMKNEVNKPFSRITFFVFHSDGDYDWAEIGRNTTEFQAGIAKAKAFPDPPVESQEGREVFATFVENLESDAGKLASAISAHDARQTQAVIARLSKTCNNCHHFFRLDIADSPEH